MHTRRAPVPPSQHLPASGHPLPPWGLCQRIHTRAGPPWGLLRALERVPLLHACGPPRPVLGACLWPLLPASLHPRGPSFPSHTPNADPPAKLSTPLLPAAAPTPGPLHLPSCTGQCPAEAPLLSTQPTPPASSLPCVPSTPALSASEGLGKPGTPSDPGTRRPPWGVTQCRLPC